MGVYTHIYVCVRLRICIFLMLSVPYLLPLKLKEKHLTLAGTLVPL